MRLLHITDVHAQLLPVYFREPSVNLGVDEALGRPPHLVGHPFLKHFSIPEGTAGSHAFTYLDFAAAAKRYGKVGGYAHLATLVKRRRRVAPRRVPRARELGAAPRRPMPRLHARPPRAGERRAEAPRGAGT
ncbi:MAG TPA: hypothetical protein VFC18_18185, partial [Burkholderiales bacterium]|nr:hypothetical protein [Burkholderiales bacterium]